MRIWANLRAGVAGLRYEAQKRQRRRRGIPEPVLIPAWDPTMPKGFSSYGPRRRVRR